MIQRYDFAPLDGITKVVFRQVYHRMFGGADRYFIPFFSPTDQHILTKRDQRELDPAANAGLPVVPQVMTCRAPDFLWAAEIVADMGYTEVNLNLGCPSGTVTAKGKGAGFLAKPEELERFFDDDAEALVTFSVDKDWNIAEITVHASNMYFRARESTSDMFASIDAAVATMERQIRKNKTRLARRLRQDAFVRTPDVTSFAPEEPEEGAFEIVRKKEFNMKPMTREEAILQMNLLEHTFFAFRDEDNEGAFAVVYKRKDGGYGLIEDAE